MKNILKFESFINEGYNLYTLKSRADHMNDLYIKTSDGGDEIFKVISIDPKSIHDGTLSIKSELDGSIKTINHSDIESTITGDDYKPKPTIKKEDPRLSALRSQSNYGTRISRFKNFGK